ncbi:MAG: prepilin-type N-terminal cleavage/methylation domain-containing protein [Myxococcales bacterium]|nr:prepilin-type N-terminal cleavage/methylation domain-containing protein [Myxococcales bacterium]
MTKPDARPQTPLGTRAFSLVELMVTVVIVGVLAGLAIYGVRRYLFNARTAEARAAIGRMGKDAVGAYSREIMSGAQLPTGGTAAVLNRLCVSASQPVPASAGAIKGGKYQSSPSDWNLDTATQGKGFACLRFTMTDPQFFQYDYKSSTDDWAQAGADGTTFDAIARGDLNGDGVLSDFRLSGKLVKAPSGSIEALIAPNIAEINALE